MIATATLESVPDSVTLALPGHGQVLICLAGGFTGMTFALDGVATGKQTWESLGAVRSDTGAVLAGSFGPVSGPGYGGGFALRADAADLSAVRVRLTAASGGTAQVTLIALAHPVQAPVTTVAGAVEVAGGALDAALRVTALPAGTHRPAAGHAPRPAAAETVAVPGNAVDGLATFDRESRDTLAAILRWQQNTYWLLYSAITQPGVPPALPEV